MTYIQPRLVTISAKIIVLSAILVTLSNTAYTQKLLGTIKDSKTKEALIGATISQKGTTNATRSDFNGKFELNLSQSGPKDSLQISYLGYETRSIKITPNKAYYDVTISEAGIVTKEVVISSSRLNEKLQESPVTVERMNVAAIKETAASGFYEGLANLKGVDMTTASLGFKVINTRGFNSTSPVRTLQIIDGMDNQAPGLNFSLGNFVGASEIDVESVDLIVGANSATYGPNAFNGVISITTKDPFKYRGLNVQLKGATRNLFDGSIRYAGVIKNRFGYKVNASYLRADDFEATNYDPIDPRNTPLPNVKNNLTGFDAVNEYGETGKIGNLNMTEEGDPDTAIKNTVFIYRDGYKEKQLTDNYKTESLKLSGGLYYKLFKENTISYNYNFGTGTTIYQGENRYSIKNIQFQQHKAEIKGERYFARAYTTLEDAGDSYDLVFTAFKLLEAAKSNDQWFKDYEIQYARMRGQGQSVEQALDSARVFANGQGSNPSSKFGPKLQPGTPEFQQKLDAVRGNPSFKSGGTRFQDKSALRHYEAQYNFNLKKISRHMPEVFKVGLSYREYLPKSFGTIFSDTLNNTAFFYTQVKNAAGTDSIKDGKPVKDSTANPKFGRFEEISTFEYGYYVSVEKKIWRDKLNLIASYRIDDHKNFKPTQSPAISAVYAINQTDRLRITYTTAVRNPTLQDQYLYYDIGLGILSGNLTGRNLILRDDYNRYLANTNQPVDSFITYIPAVKSERVKTIELGYKGIVTKKLYIDASYYYSIYTDFIGFVIGFDRDPKNQADKTYRKAFRVSSNARDIVTTQGVSLGLNYYFMKNYSLSGNYTYAILNERDSTDPLIPNFNTPPHKYNISFGARNIKNKYGYNITYKWVNGFDYTGSPQFTGYIPSYGLVDAQVNYKYIPLNTTFKLGCSNLLNNKHFEAYGAPYIGILGYFSLNFEI